jgi:hypothetical protein
MRKVAALLTLILAGCATRDPVRIAIMGVEILNSDFRGEPVVSSHAAIDHLHDRLVASSRLQVVERRYRPAPDEKLVPAHWIGVGTLAATCRWSDFDPGSTRCAAEVVINFRIVRVEDGVILYSKTHRGEAEGATTGPDVETRVMDYIRMANEASRIAAAKLADDLVELAR